MKATVARAVTLAVAGQEGEQETVRPTTSVGAAQTLIEGPD